MATDSISRLTDATPADYERLLSLIVCANPRDRFATMDKLKSDGIAAAIGFLGGCTLTDESYEHAGITADRINAAQMLAYRAGDLLTAIVKLAESDHGEIEECARAAREHVSAIAERLDEATLPAKDRDEGGQDATSDDEPALTSVRAAYQPLYDELAAAMSGLGADAIGQMIEQAKEASARLRKTNSDDDDEPATDDELEVERRNYLLLHGDNLVDAVYAVRALALAIDERGAKDSRTTALAGALVCVGEKLETALNTVSPTFEQAVGKYLSRS